MRNGNVPVVLALCAAVMLLAINTLTHQSTVWAPSGVSEAPLVPFALAGSLDGASELLHSAAADMDQVQAHLQTAARAIQLNGRRS